MTQVTPQNITPSPSSITFYSSFENTIKYLEMGFNEAFPDDIIPESVTIVPSLKNEHELTFYKKYAGIYKMKDDYEIFVNNPFSTIHLLQNGNSTWGNSLSFFSIHYLSIDIYNKDNCFYIWKDFTMTKIENIMDFNIDLSDYVKISSPNGNDKFLTNLAYEKKEESSSFYKNGKVPENTKLKIREFIKKFYILLQTHSYNEIIETVSSKYGLSVDGINSDLVYFKENADDIQILKNYFKNTLQYEFDSLDSFHDKTGFQMYLNVFFSESAQKVSTKYPNTYFIELRYKQSEDYVAFILNDEGENILNICYVYTWVNLD